MVQVTYTINGVKTTSHAEAKAIQNKQGGHITVSYEPVASAPPILIGKRKACYEKYGIITPKKLTEF